MKLILSPQRRDDTLEIIKQGDKLFMNGELFDFSPMGDGDTLPVSAISSFWFIDKVDKIDNELVFTILFPIPPNYSQEQAFPVPLVNVPDGIVKFPKPLPIVVASREEVQESVENVEPTNE